MTDRGATSPKICAQSTYTANPGEPQCIACPAGRITPGADTKSGDDCVSPEWNFIQAIMALILLQPFCYQYVVRSRFERLAFLRQWRVTKILLDNTRQLHSMYSLYANKERAERILQWGQH